jgi:hypothetical protein
MNRRKALKILGWTVLGILAVPIGLYLIALTINRHDQPPSAAAIRLHEVLDQRPPVPDADNAYLYVLGFSAAEGSDPHEVGLQWRAWMKERGYRSGSEKENPLSTSLDFHAVRPAEINNILTTCTTPDRRCAELLETSSAGLANWFSSNPIQLERYRALLAYVEWREEIPPDVQAPLPLYAGVLDGQRLLFTDAWQRASAGDVSAVRDAFQSDIAFWRRVLASSDLLITKMIAVAALRQHFALGNLVLRRLPAEQTLQAVPADWSTPLSDEERSILRVMAGELAYLEGILREMTDAPTAASLAPDHFSNRIHDRLVSPLFQPQDTVNQAADLYLGLAQRFAVPLERYPEQLKKTPPPPPPKRLYNAIGDLLMREGALDGMYGARVGDVEGMRRAALIANELRSRGIAANDIEDALRSASLRNPYNDEPFQWDEGERAVVFVGLQSGEKGRHAYLY